MIEYDPPGLPKHNIIIIFYYCVQEKMKVTSIHYFWAVFRAFQGIIWKSNPLRIRGYFGFCCSCSISGDIAYRTNVEWSTAHRSTFQRFLSKILFQNQILTHSTDTVRWPNLSNLCRSFYQARSAWYQNILASLFFQFSQFFQFFSIFCFVSGSEISVCVCVC